VGERSADGASLQRCRRNVATDSFSSLLNNSILQAFSL
jgi:hypothetical protein